MNTYRILTGDVIGQLRTLPDGCVQCCVTSPPYWGLRDYGTASWEDGDPECNHKPGNARRVGATTLGGGTATSGHQHEGYRNVCAKCGARRIDNQIGLETTPAKYVARLVEVFEEVRRVLRDDGTLWLNLGDSYAGSGGAGEWSRRKAGKQEYAGQRGNNVNRVSPDGLKPKDLVGIPWRVALALQDAGWWMRAEIIWAKKAPMPESVTDRPTRSHEQIFLLTKRARYFYDAEAVREAFADDRMGKDGGAKPSERNRGGRSDGFTKPNGIDPSANGGRNMRDVWLLGPEPYPEAHFATFPTEIPRRAILAGTSERGCCPACGAPWRRVVEKANGSAPASWKGSKFDDGKNLVLHPTTQRREDASTATQYAEGSTAKRLALLRQQARENGGEYAVSVRTTGWQPICTCDAGEPVACTVLDPFLGSGTTLATAVGLGRDGIGIDLNPEYAELARRRIAAVGPLLAKERE